MKTRSSWVLFSLFVFLAGCTSLRTGGEVQYGRQALLEGRNEAALGYFYSAAQMDPSYIYRTGSSPTSSARISGAGASSRLAVRSCSKARTRSPTVIREAGA